MPRTNEPAVAALYPERRPTAFDAAFFILAGVFVFLQLFEFPLTPIYFDGDTLVPVSNAVRTLDGQVIYRDFFHFVTPGADIYYAAAFGIFGQRIWVINATIWLLTLAQVALIWHFSRRILKGWLIYLPALIFLTLGFRNYSIDGSYRLFSLVFALAAVAIVLEHRSIRRLAAAGALCAVASAFQQPRGLLILIAICVFVISEALVDRMPIRSLLRAVAVCACTFAGVFIASQVYFAWAAGPENYFRSTVGFLANYRSDPFNNNTAYLSDLRHLIEFARTSGSLVSGYTRSIFVAGFYYLIVPYVYLAALAYAFLRRNEPGLPQRRSALLLATAGILLFLGVSAPTIIRVFQVAAPALVVLIWLVQQTALRRVASPTVAILVILAAGLTFQRQLVEKYPLETPAGSTLFLFAPTYERYRWIGENTTPGESLYEPHHPNFYFPFHLKNPTPLYMARDSEYTPREQVDQVLRSLEATRPRILVWPSNWSRPAEQREPGDNLGPLWDFVQANYTMVKTFTKPDDPMLEVYGHTQVWELRPASP